MERDERQRLRAITSEVTGWADQAIRVLSYRAKIRSTGDDAVDRMRRAIVDVRVAGQIGWRIMLLHPSDARDLSDIARQNQLPPISIDEDKALVDVTTHVTAALGDAKTIIGARRFFSGSKKREAAADAAGYLLSYREWAFASGVPQMLDRLAPESDRGLPDVSEDNALVGWVGLSDRIADLGRPQELLSAAVTAELPAAISIIEWAPQEEDRRRSQVRAAGEAVRRSEVRQVLAEMPVERLKDVTRDRLCRLHVHQYSR